MATIKTIVWGLTDKLKENKENLPNKIQDNVCHLSITNPVCNDPKKSEYVWGCPSIA
jgi:hypothetical protein